MGTASRTPCTPCVLVSPDGARRALLTHCSSQIKMRVDEQCNVLCRIDSLSSAQAKAFRKRVEDDYRVNMCAARPPHHLAAVGADGEFAQDP